MPIKRILLLIMGALCFFSSAEDVTTVLQNNLNGYEGCSDSYLFRTTDDSSTFTQNFGSENYLVTAH